MKSGLLKSLKVREALVSFWRQTEVRLPDDRDEACSVIGKFTQGSVADGKRLTRRLVIDQGEHDLLVCDTRQSGTLAGAPLKCPRGISSIIMMGPSSSTPTLGQACWLRPHQPLVDATEVRIRRCGPGSHRQHLCQKICTSQARWCQSICGSQKM